VLPHPGDPVEAAALLAGFGVPTCPAVLCRTAQAAGEAVATFSPPFPAVVKLAAADHRSDVGGVRLGLTDAAQVRAAAAELLRLDDAVLVSPQLHGVELVVGAVRDPGFGPVVMVGLGGIWVEVLGDVAFALAPLTGSEAMDLVAGLRGYPLLTGARGTPAVDLEALAGVVVSVGDVLAAIPAVTGVDLNPVLASPSGVVAVDWKIWT
jgi:succinyl-CoA synthetase beta subunit